MHGPGVGNEVRAHNPGVVQEDVSVSSRHEDRVAVLGVDEIAVGEVGGVEGAGEAVAGQGCEEGGGTVC